MQLELALSLPRDDRSVPAARHLVHAGMLTIGVDADCTHDIELALSEACTNVLQHGDPAAEYEVRLHLDDQRCLLWVSELGGGLAGSLAQEPPASVPDVQAEHGRGLLLMGALVDRIGFRRLPGRARWCRWRSGWSTPPANTPMCSPAGGSRGTPALRWFDPVVGRRRAEGEWSARRRALPGQHGRRWWSVTARRPALAWHSRTSGQLGVSVSRG